MEHEPDDDQPLLRSTRLPPAAAALRTSADDSTARARELREALDELRAELDGTAGRARTPGEPKTGPQPGPPVAPPAEPPDEPVDRPPAAAPLAARRAGRVAVAVAGLAAVILAGVGVVRIVAWSMAAAPQASSAATPTPSSPGSAPTGATSPSAIPSASASGPTPGPAVALPGGMPVSGPGADAPGADAFAVVGARGAVDVWERLVVRPGTTSVRLAPAPTSALPRTTAGQPADLQVTVDGRRVTPSGDGDGWQVTAPDGGAFTQVVVRYRLVGALVRVTPAPPGRVTLVLRPVTGPAAVAADDPVVVRLTDPRVGSVYCPEARAPLCATRQGTTHVATVPAGTAPVVLAQVTLR